MHTARLSIRRLGVGLAAAAALSACSQAVVVEPDFPKPLVEPLPLAVGLRYSPEFTGYQYAEDLPNDVDWSFDIGAANRALFDKVFNEMFDRAVDLGEREPAAAGVDLVVEPRVEALEFSLPRQSRTDQYAVWIKYKLHVTRPDGSVITDWPIAAYGQSDSKRFGGAKSMAVATARAMRDAAAQIAAELADRAKVEAIISGENPDTPAPADEVADAGTAEANEPSEEVALGDELVNDAS
ncbi:MAG: hypothetical protein QNJ73_16875 [Gammaproteobacteria bacterium]|nr:hypothetical protein [Gammaproteobacteria bacterium]